MATTIKLDNGKYEFDLEDGQIRAARRHGHDRQAGFDLRFQNCFVAALLRIKELEQELRQRAEDLYDERLERRERK